MRRIPMFAGTAFATPKLAVGQKGTRVTVTLTQRPTDEQPSAVDVFVPTGYKWFVQNKNGKLIGTASGTFFLRDAGDRPQRVTGFIVAVHPAANGHEAEWRLELSAPGLTMRIPVYVDRTSASSTDFGVLRLEVALPAANVPQGTPNRAPSGAQLLRLVLTLKPGILVSPVGPTVWKALFTPYTTGTTKPNTLGAVETRAFVGPGAVTLRVHRVAAHRASFAGKVTKSGYGLPNAIARIFVAGHARFTAVTNAAGVFSIVRRFGGHGRLNVRAVANVGVRDVTALGCSKLTRAGISCVSATANPFRALSQTIRFRF